ncbi:hypothetical protein P3719_18780 [Vibrio parahaemolyticus]|uniref:Uncharacterized protein n=3 Tax=Vibrio TaxID=662 RepID=A0AA47JN21_VIBPH|nr:MULTISPECIES: hypothetical protein [Vibrio]EJG1066192.1 hypothetical protein [Vibrio parahaemolyticus O1]MDW1807613.1 hypothetical protein [Vibrio sp. Vb2362]MDW2297845.1 hypothetical protein [Vibrio sp. 1404]OOH98780.1 hypothetical protein BIW16_18385 [Vibrio sp. OULL4]ALR95701.1 hypothetical protein AT730_26025 [Vibrio alginolyticus]
MNPISLKTLPNFTSYVLSISEYLLLNVLENDKKIIKKIQSGDELPLPEIKNSLDQRFEDLKLEIFDYEILKSIAMNYPHDHYAEKIVSCNYDYHMTMTWFKKAILQSSVRPLAFAQLELG